MRHIIRETVTEYRALTHETSYMDFSRVFFLFVCLFVFVLFCFFLLFAETNYELNVEHKYYCLFVSLFACLFLCWKTQAWAQ